MTGPLEMTTDLLETVSFWREFMRDRIETCGPTPEEFAAVKAEVDLFTRVSRALAWALKGATQ
jgi:hypothetical protein